MIQITILNSFMGVLTMPEPSTAAKGQETDPKAASSQATGTPAPEGQGQGKPTDAEAALLKENMAFKAELKKLKASQEKNEQDKLAEAGKYKELHEKALDKLKATNARLVQADSR